jgi:serine O-acetyltransferase
MGTGAVLIGDITVGDDAEIGANAVLLESVPAGGVAVGVPAKVVRIKK